MSEPTEQNQKTTPIAQSDPENAEKSGTGSPAQKEKENADIMAELQQNITQAKQTENQQKSTIQGTVEVEQSSQQPDRNSYEYGYLPTEVDANTQAQMSYQYQYPQLSEPVHYGMPYPQFNSTAYCQPMYNPMHFQAYNHHPQFHQPAYYPHNWAGFVPPPIQPHWQHHRQFQPFQQKGHNLGGKFRGGCRFSDNFKDKGYKKQKRSKSSSSQSSQRSQSKSKSHKKHWHKNRKSKEYDYKNKYHNKKIQQSHTENSQSEAQLKALQNEVKNIALTDEKRENYNDFENCLIQFFNKYDIKEKNRAKTVKYLLSRYSKLEDLDPLISLLFELQRVSPHYFTSKQLNFSAIVKAIIKKGFQIQEINGLLDKKLYIKNKKVQHDSKFRQKFPNAQQIKFLQIHDLLSLDLDKTLFLVDGNNIMQKQKKLRLYYESNYPNERAEGQVRLTWLFAESLTAQVFFDTKYGDDIYKGIKQSILSQYQKELVDGVPVFYADKHLNQSNTADMKIVSRLAEIVEGQKYKGYEIVLVSADRQLGQLCNAIRPIKKTAGRFIFKCCKKMIRQRNYNNPETKDLIKRIFTY